MEADVADHRAGGAQDDRAGEPRLGGLAGLKLPEPHRSEFVTLKPVDGDAGVELGGGEGAVALGGAAEEIRSEWD